MEKFWWINSNTVRGALLAALPVLKLILSSFGVHFGDEEANTLVDGFSGLAGAAGVILVIARRTKAQKELEARKAE